MNLTIKIVITVEYAYLAGPNKICLKQKKREKLYSDDIHQYVLTHTYTYMKREKKTKQNINK